MTLIFAGCTSSPLHSCIYTAYEQMHSWAYMGYFFLPVFCSIHIVLHCLMIEPTSKKLDVEIHEKLATLFGRNVQFNVFTFWLSTVGIRAKGPPLILNLCCCLEGFNECKMVLYCFLKPIQIHWAINVLIFILSMNNNSYFLWQMKDDAWTVTSCL